MSIKNVLFGKVDLDTIATAFVMQARPAEQAFRAIAGSAGKKDLEEPSTLCIEVGGSGRTSENNFDHHGPSQEAPTLSACAQSLERLAKIIRYVDEMDRGVHKGKTYQAPPFPSLSQLVSGMLISERDPNQQMEKGMEIFRAVLHSGIDPYASMEPILDELLEGRGWAEAKRQHNALAETALASTKWFNTKAGRKLAVVETTWRGAPGVLYGKGAGLVIALNPHFEQAGNTIRKFTVAGNAVSVLPVLSELNTLEQGWGGPAHGTIIGSDQSKDSGLSLDQVAQVVIENL